MLNVRRRVEKQAFTPVLITKHGEQHTTEKQHRDGSFTSAQKEQDAEWEEEEEENQGVFAPNGLKFQQNRAAGASIDIVEALKDCIFRKDSEYGIQIHAEIIREGLLQQDSYIGCALVNMYAKCGAFTKAEEVLQDLPARNVATWNALIAGYIQHGHTDKALSWFMRMEMAGLSPNVVTFVCILKAYGSIGDSLKGQEIHSRLEREYLGNNIVVSNALIDMYSKCGLLKRAQEVFDKLAVADVISWTTLISGYTQHGFGEEALECFEKMQAKFNNISPNNVTFLCILKACGGTAQLKDKGQQVHAEICRKGLLVKDIRLGNALVDMYFRCGTMEEAQNVFENLPFQDVVSWNALITGYLQHGRFTKALGCYEEMRAVRCLFPDEVTIACVLKACSSITAIAKGQYIHAEMSTGGLLEEDVVVGAALLQMYASCGILEKAQEVFDELPCHNVVLWTALISGYSQHGYFENALGCYKQMGQGGFVADAVTFMCILRAYASLGASDKGQEIHAEIVMDGMFEKDVVVGTAIVDMYICCNMLMEAKELFIKYTNRDVVAYNVLITRFAQRFYCEEALAFFDKMELDGVCPDKFTLVSALKACGSLGAAYKGQRVHSTIIQLGFLNADTVVATSLVELYASCGMLMEAQDVFNVMGLQDVVSLTVLMSGYAQLGMNIRVFDLFDSMLKECKEPTELTFTIMLNACSRTGSLNQGQMLFDVMSMVFGIFPTPEHYNCMVDLLSRAGCVDKAIALTRDIPFVTDLTTWHTVLGFCQSQGVKVVGKLAFDFAMQLDENDSSAYVCMSNIYAAPIIDMGTKDILKANQ